MGMIMRTVMRTPSTQAVLSYAAVSNEMPYHHRNLVVQDSPSAILRQDADYATVTGFKDFWNGVKSFSAKINPAHLWRPARGVEEIELTSTVHPADKDRNQQPLPVEQHHTQISKELELNPWEDHIYVDDVFSSALPVNSRNRPDFLRFRQVRSLYARRMLAQSSPPLFMSPPLRPLPSVANPKPRHHHHLAADTPYSLHVLKKLHTWSPSALSQVQLSCNG